MAQSLGQPTLQFYAPAVSLLSVINYRLGFSLAGAVTGVFALGIVLHALGVYLLSAYVWRKSHYACEPAGVALEAWAALMASGLSLWGTYTLSNGFIRGALAEFTAMALVPYALLALAAVILTPCPKWRQRYAGFYAIALAAVILTHNITALILAYLSALAGLAVLWRWAVEGWSRQSVSFETAQVMLAGGIVGVCLAATFWLPAMSLRHEVYLELIHTTRLFTVKENALEWWRGLIPSPGWINIGATPLVALAMLALLGFIRLVSRIGAWFSPFRHCSGVIYTPQTGTASPPGTALQPHHLMVGFGLVAALCSFLVTRPALPVYGVVPLLEIIQFPWRFMGWASLAWGLVAGWASAVALVVLLTGVPARWSGRWAVAGLVPWAGVIAIVATQLTLSWPGPWTLPNDLRDMTYERMLDRLRSNYLTATGVDEYRPVVAPPPVWRADYLIAAPPWRHLGGQVYLAGGWAGPERLASSRANHVISWEMPPSPADVARRVRVGVYAMPGWRAEADGQPLPTDALSPDAQGLLLVEVPPGARHLQVRRILLPIQLAGNVLSLVGLLLLLGLMLASVASSAKRPVHSTSARKDHDEPLV
jgi:hypothetical protein